MSFNKIILEKIESYANNFQLPEYGVIRKAALFGFHLRDEEVEQLKAEIERLKEVIKTATDITNWLREKEIKQSLK